MAAARGEERAVDGIPVEVQLDNGGWYNAFLMDVINDEALIQFPCHWMPEAIYPFSQVRFPPAEETDGRVFQSGMLVEILVCKTKGHYQGWFKCRVKDIKANFCQFKYENSNEECYDFVDLCMVRKPNMNPHMAIDMFYTYTIPIPEDLREYAKMDNVHKTLKDAIKSALVNYDADNGELVIISRNASDIICAEILQKAHLRSLAQRTRVLQITGKLSLQLEIAQKGGYVEDVLIPYNLLGVAMGREKVYYNTANNLEGIWLIYINRNLNKFVIYGKTPEVVKEARLILEIRTEFYPIPDNFLSQLVGRESGNIYSIIESTGAIEIRIPNDEEVPEAEKIEGHILLAILGRNEVIERVKIFLEFQIDHIYEVQALRRKRVEINDKVSEFFKNSEKCEEQLLSTQVNLTDRNSETIQLTQVSPSATNLSSFNIEELDDLEDLLLSDDEDDKIVILEAGKQLNVSGETMEVSSSENINAVMTPTETDNTSGEFSGLQELPGNTTDTENKSKEMDCDRNESDDSDVIFIESKSCESVITIATATETDNISDEASGMQELPCSSDKLKDISQENSEQTESVEKDSEDNEKAAIEDEKKLNVSMESTDSNDTVITIADTTNTSEELSRVQEILCRSSNLQISHEKSTEFECDITESPEKMVSKTLLEKSTMDVDNTSTEAAAVQEVLSELQISHEKITDSDGDKIESIEKESNENVPEKTIRDIDNTSSEPLLLKQVTTGGVTNSEEIVKEIDSILSEAVNISIAHLEQENQQRRVARLDEQQSSSSEFYDSIENSEGEHDHPSRNLELRTHLASSINAEIDSTIKAHDEMYKQLTLAQRKYDLTQTDEYKNSLQILLDLQLKFATISNEISSEKLGKLSVAIGTSDDHLSTTQSIATQIEQDLEKKLDKKTVATQSEIESKILELETVPAKNTKETSTSSKDGETVIPTEKHLATPQPILIKPTTLKPFSTETDDSKKIEGTNPSEILPPKLIAVQTKTLPSSESAAAVTTTKIPAARKRKWRKLDQICLKNKPDTENVEGNIPKESAPIVIKTASKTSSAESSRTVIPTKKYVEALKSIPVNLDKLKHPFKKPANTIPSVKIGSIKDQTGRVVEIQKKPLLFVTPPEITITQLVPPPGYMAFQPVSPKVTSTVTDEGPATNVVTPTTIKSIPKKIPEIKANIKVSFTEGPSKVNEVEIKTGASSKIGEVQIKPVVETPRLITAKAMEPKNISTSYSNAVKAAESSATEASPPFIEVKYKKKNSAASKISRVTTAPRKQDDIQQRAPLMKSQSETAGIAQVQDKSKCLTPVEHKEETPKNLEKSVPLSIIGTPSARGFKDKNSKQPLPERSSSSSSQKQSVTSTPDTVIYDHDLSLERRTLPSFIANSFQALKEISKASPHATKYQVSEFMSRESNIFSQIDASGDAGAKCHDSTVPPTDDKKSSTEQQTGKSRLIDLLWRMGYKGPLLGEEVFKAALKGGLESLEFNALIVYLTERLHGFMELQEHITPMLNEINSDIFTVELGEFLRQIRCPYEDLITTDVNERLKKRQHRRLLIKFLASEVICNNLLHNEFQSRELQKYLNRNYLILNRDSMIDILNLPVLPTENTVRALEEQFNRYNDTESSSDDSVKAISTTKKNN